MKLIQAWAMPVLLVTALCVVPAANSEPADELSRLQQQVIDAEQRFAASTAARDFVAFQSFLAEEAAPFFAPGIWAGAMMEGQWVPTARRLSWPEALLKMVRFRSRSMPAWRTR